VRLLAIALLFMAGAAQADADAWKGAYGGFGAGGAKSHASWLTNATTGVATEPVDHKASSALAGVQLGYNLKAGRNFIIGVEGSVYGAHLEERTESALGAAAPNRERITKITYPLQGTVHLGFVTERTLTYVRGGFAYASLELQAINHQVGNIATWDDHATGYSVGAGFEYRLSRPWSLGFGYDRLNLRAVNLSTVNSGGVTVQANDFHATVQLFVLRLNYRY
jgi:outer membrane immunogenic protein